MRFADSETQKLMRTTARSYLAGAFPPQRLFAIERGDEQLGAADTRGFAELGWLGLLVPESAAGSGASLLEAAVVVDELGYAAAPTPIAAHNIAAYVLSNAGDSDELRDRLRRLASGDELYTISESTRLLSPNQTKSDDQEYRGRSPLSGGLGGVPPETNSGPRADAAGGARRGRGEQGSYALLAIDGERLNGILPLVPFASSSDFVVAPITFDGEPAFAAVPLAQAEREPVRLLDRSSYANVRFRDADAADVRVLATGDAARALHERCDALSTAFALIEMAGMLQRVLEMTSQYISQRVQFGQPIAKFQAARHRAAELLLQTETTRWAAYYGLWRFQQDPLDTDGIWLAKHWAVRAADRAYQISHLLHGGVGVGIDYPLHLYTQGIAALAVRAGTMNEMVDRTVESLRLEQSA